MKKFLRYIFLLLAVAIMGFIFYFSAQTSTNSAKQSGTLIEFFAKIFVKDFQSFNIITKNTLIKSYQGIIRTLAHASIYGALGFFVKGFFSTYNVKKAISFLYSIGFCFLYAVSDEIHQLFVAGRGFQIIDIIVDTTGAFLGVLFMTFISIILRSREKSEKLIKQ